VRESLASLVEEFRRHEGETAVVLHRGNRRYATTYGELAVLAGRFAAELEARGIGAGERVVVWGANSAEWIGVFFGCLLRGVIAVPLDAAGNVDFAGKVVGDVGAKLVVGDLGLVGELKDVGILAFSELRERLPKEPLFAVSEAVKEDAAFQIVFTSGTTSEPKGIVHTHRNVLVSLRPIEMEMRKYLKYERFVHPLRFLHTLPLSHVFGQFMGLWVPALLGAEVHFVEQIEAARLVEMMKREVISVVIVVPRVAQLLRGHLLGEFAGLGEELERAKGLPVWKRWWRFRRVHRVLGWKFWAVISGGASLPRELEEFWNGLGLAVIQGYGMTETVALVTLNHPFKIGKGTIGKALPGREVKLSAEGEILVRGDMLAGATWQAGGMRPREGEWLATGDLAEKNEAGELRFLGRKGDVIVTGAGMNVHPGDLEAALNRQAGVRGCAVVGCETANGMEAVAVVLFGGSDEELRGVVDAANTGLAGYQKIRRVLRWPGVQLPYTGTGKLLRRKVAEWACGVVAGGSVVGSEIVQSHPCPKGEGMNGAPGGVSGFLPGSLEALVEEVTGERVVEDGELHVDSLGMVQLQSLLEQRMGVEIGDEAMAGVRTMGELRALVGGGGSKVQGWSGFRAQGPGLRVRGGGLVGIDELEEDVYPRWAWSWVVWGLRVGFMECLMRPLVWLIARPKVVRESAKTVVGPVLVVANHVTAYDGALVLYALPGTMRRRVAAAMAGEMLRDYRHGRGQGNWVMNLLVRPGYWLLTALFNVFPLPRRSGFRKSFAFAGEAMDKGYSVLVFPEGTRSRSGEMQGFRAGIGLLAKESGVGVLPVSLVGLGVSDARWVRQRKIEIRVGRLVQAGEGEDAAGIAARLEGEVRRLGSDIPLRR
jgi:long-chain acyl-CoA synthetase